MAKRFLRIFGKKTSFLLYAFSSLLYLTCFGQADINKELLAVDQLIIAIEKAFESRSDSLVIIIDEAKVILDKYSVDDSYQPLVKLKYWEARYYIDEKEEDIALNILEKVYPIAYRKRHLYLGKICALIANQKHKLDSSFDGVTIFEEIFREIDTSKRTEFLFSIYEGQGDYHFANYELDKAIEFYQKALSLKDDVKSDLLFYNIFLKIANSYYLKGELFNALSANEQSILYAEKNQNSKSISSAKTKSAIIKSNLGLYEEAMTSYFELVKVCARQNDLLCLASNYLNVGTIYAQLGDMDNAIEWAKKAIKLTDGQNDPRFKDVRNDASYSLALNYNKIRKFNQSLRLSKRLLQETVESMNVDVVGNTHMLIADNYYNLENIEQAKEYFNEAFSILKKQGSQLGLSNYYLQYGLFMLNTGETIKGGEYCKEAYVVLEQVDNVELKSNCIDCLRQFYEAIGDSKLSVMYSQKRVILEDSICRNENIGKLASGNIRFENEDAHIDDVTQVDRIELLSETQVAELQKRDGIIIGGLVLLVSGFLFFAYVQNLNKVYSRLMKSRNDELIESNEKLFELSDEVNIRNSELKERNSELKERNAELSHRKIQLEAELKSKLLLISSNSEVYTSLKQELLSAKSIDVQTKAKLAKILRQNRNTELLKEIDLGFMELNKDFIQTITAKYNNLTSNNLKLCVLIKMNLQTKEISQIIHASPGSVKVAKSRLRKRLGIEDRKITLVSFLNSLEKPE